MKTTIKEWSVQELINKLDKINDQPLYQRGKVWTPKKNQLLIESIFRGIDIPKIYLRKISRNHHEYEVADGQQRIYAIQKFFNNEISLPEGMVNGLKLSKINKRDLRNMKISEITTKYPSVANFFFNEYKLTIAIIEGASNKEIRTLFGRLQEGNRLNPAEKRNAILSQIGNEISNFVLNHDFFTNCKIPISRYRHHDYLAHIFALIIFNNQSDLKATLLEKLYLENRDVYPNDFVKNVALVLDKMHEIDMESEVKIKNKFSFIDIFHYLYTQIDCISDLDSEDFADFYDSLERKRIEKRFSPEDLITDPFWGKDMYQYIVSYKSEGYSTSNIKKRLKSFTKLIDKFLN